MEADGEKKDETIPIGPSPGIDFKSGSGHYILLRVAYPRSAIRMCNMIPIQSTNTIDKIALMFLRFVLCTCTTHDSRQRQRLGKEKRKRYK